MSNLCSQKLIDYIFETSKFKPREPAQKFHRLLAEGFALNPDTCQIETLSLIPVVASSHKKKIWNILQEKVGNIHFNYVPMLNFPIVKDLMVFIYSFFWVIQWAISKKASQKIVICDALKLSISGSVILACKLCKVRVVGIVTDLPDLMIGNKKNFGLKYKIYRKLSYSVITNFDTYILLTKQMNEVVNLGGKPHIIMEGLVDIKMSEEENYSSIKDTNRILLYAGGIYEQYGIKNLIKAFMKLEDNSLRLHIFGPGDMEPEMPGYMNLDKRLVYKGIAHNAFIIECQLKATLLINPRPTNEEFTKFSFPSKNMEYMASGTPMITTRLPGMPLEYYDYVYVFDDESIEGMAHTLKSILQKSDNELKDFGSRAKQFVLDNKSNVMQARRILDFLKVT